MRLDYQWEEIRLSVCKLNSQINFFRYMKDCTKDGDLNICTLHIDCVTVNDIGNYTCHAWTSTDNLDYDGFAEVERTVILNLTGNICILMLKNSFHHLSLDANLWYSLLGKEYILQISSAILRINIINIFLHGRALL